MRKLIAVILVIALSINISFASSSNIYQDIAARNNSSVMRTDYSKEISSIQYEGYDTSREWQFKANEYNDVLDRIEQLCANSKDPYSEENKIIVGDLIHDLYPSMSAEYARNNASYFIYMATSREPKTDNYFGPLLMDIVFIALVILFFVLRKVCHKRKEKNSKAN